MSPTMTLRGHVKFSVKKMIAGADLNTSNYMGPGELLLAPPMLGDITSIRLTGSETWNVGHDAYLASTQGIVKDHKRQGLGKAMFSGEGLFVYKMSGKGIMWLTSFGAIIRKDVGWRATGSRLWADSARSSSTAKSTWSTTGTWLPGTQSMSWSASHRAASSPTLPPARASCASLPGPAPSSSRRETRCVEPPLSRAACG